MEKESEFEDQKDQESPADIQAMIDELPIPDKYKPLVTGLLTSMLNSLVKINTRLDAVENKQMAPPDSPDAFDGLTPDQRYNILMARASGPAAQAQMQLWQGLLSGLGGNRGGGGGGGMDELIKSAEKLQSLKTILMPEPTPLQIAMDKALIAQQVAQTRLMNKVAGHTTSTYLDKLEADLGAEAE